MPSSNQPIVFSVIALVVAVASFVRTVMLQRQALVLPHFKSKWSSFSQTLGWTLDFWGGFEFKDDDLNRLPDHADTPMLDEVAQKYNAAFTAYLWLHKILTNHAVKHLEDANDMFRMSDGTLKMYDDILHDMGQDAEWENKRIGRELDREGFVKKHLGEHVVDATTGDVRASASYQREFVRHRNGACRVLPLIRFLNRRLASKKRFYDAVFAVGDD